MRPADRSAEAALEVEEVVVEQDAGDWAFEAV